MSVFKLDVKPMSKWNVEDSRNFHKMSLEDRLAYNEELLKQELPKYIKEFNRLRKKYGDERLMDKETFYSHPYWFDEADSINYYGGKNYAQFQLYNWGAISIDDVEAWNE